MLNDLHVALVGVWGLMLVIGGSASLHRPHRMLRLGIWRMTPIAIPLGLPFPCLSFAHFTGILHVDGAILIEVLGAISLWWSWFGRERRGRGPQNHGSISGGVQVIRSVHCSVYVGPLGPAMRHGKMHAWPRCPSRGR